MSNAPENDKPVARRGRGRPRFEWTDQIEAFLWRMMVAGLSLRAIVQIAKSDEFKNTPFPSFDVIMDRIREDAEFGNKYHQMKAIQSDLLAEDIVDIIDRRHPDYITADLEERKAAVTERKWLMGRLSRKKWGDIKMTMTEVTGANGAPLIPPQVVDTRDMTPEAQAALYQALQIIKAQAEAEDIPNQPEENDRD